MNHPLRARYGAKNNGHDLLSWEGQSGSLPPELLGLTDAPSTRVGDEWSPALGCGAVGEWWALWCTIPDETASRGGMVHSEVALWRLDEIGAVDDLRPILASLSGQEIIPATSPELLRAVAEALISSERPPVVSDLQAWMGIIADLWTRLWSEARRGFSARVAISPPQGGNSVAPPLLFYIPPQRLLEWSGYPVIRVAAGVNSSSRAANWLIGKEDSTFTEILTLCEFNSTKLKDLSLVAYAADCLDELRELPCPQHALDLLRLLIRLAPNPNTATNLKQEALLELDTNFSGVSSSLVLSLRNLDATSLPIERRTESMLTTWVSCQTPRLSLSDARKLLTSLEENQAQTWWQQSVRKALSDGLANPDKQWAKSAFNWLGLPDCAEILKDILPISENVEAGLFAVSAEVSLSETALQQFQTQTIVRKWSRLHAWSAIKAFPPQDALRLQREFPGNPLTGLEYLVEILPGATLIKETISTPDPRLIQLVAQRTARELELLYSLDATIPTWRTLWSAHVAAGGTHWPPNANYEVLGHGLLDAVLAGDEPKGLIVALAQDLANTTLQYPKRSELWQTLSSTGSTALLPKVADALIRMCNTGQHITTPERQLVEEVINQVRKTRLSARVLAALLSWDVQLDEKEVIRWLSSPTRKDWTPSIATAVGKAVSDKRWKRAAEEIYDLFKGGTPELRPAVEACQTLLPRWQRFVFSFPVKGNSSSSLDTIALVNRVSELGAELAPDELESIWVRAGGQLQKLPSGRTPAIRWQQAATLAHQGALKDGLRALVRELKEGHPYNKRLCELETLIIRL